MFSSGGRILYNLTSHLLVTSSLFVRLRELTPRFRLARLMKDDRVSLGLQPGSGTDAALERPGTFSRRSWQPMSLTSRVPAGGGAHESTAWTPLCPRHNSAQWELLVRRTCERRRLGHGAVLVLCGDDAGPGTEGRRRQQGQLLHDAAAARVVLGQLVEALLQRVAQEVQLLTGLIESSLSLECKTPS